MTFLTRAVAIAAIAFGISGLMGASTPGFAFELDKSINVRTALPVPQNTTEVIAVPDDASTPVPSDPAPTDSAVAAVQVEPELLADTDPRSDAVTDYASLAAAVAAQQTDRLDNDLTCLAGAIYFEAKGEPLSGQLAVAEVILNRAKSGRFPTSICSVVTQRGQFSFVRGGRVPAITGNGAYRTAVAVARVAIADAWDSPASDAMYFHARRAAPGWRMTKVAAIGNHVFYR